MWKEMGVLWLIQFEEDQSYNSMENNKKLERATLIPEATVSYVRSSPRLVKSKDEHTLNRAEERVAKKNLEISRGMSHTDPSSSLPFIAATSILQQLGFNLGSCEIDRTRNLQQLSDFITERTEVEHDEGELLWLASDSDEENLEAVEIDALKCLCGDLMEEVFDEDSFHLSSAKKLPPKNTSPVLSHA
jgi:hypothetical protein